VLAQPSTISVVVCTYTEQRWDDLVAAVASLQQQSRPPLEVVVVVDYNAALLARVQQQLTGVTAVANSQVRGLSGARNTGIACSRGALIAFLDDDAVAAPDWLARLEERYADPRVLGVGGTITPTWLQRQPSWFPAEFGWVVGCSYVGQPTQVAPVRNLIGCNMSFRREVFEQVGGFCSKIGRIGDRPVGGEETELCIRVQQHRPDALILYDPAAKVSQWVPASRGRWQYFRARCYAEGHSKAMVSHLVGMEPALATERSYVLRTLPLGVLRNTAAALIYGDGAGLSRAAAIVAGLAITVAGYTATAVGQRLPFRSRIPPPSSPSEQQTNMRETTLSRRSG